ncbi:MAG: DUF938 domain-containing protein [Oceanospirillaceae bacterium]|nr:DUF938 domain-containing protein [Oceanospirillaceae bacterium]
MLNFSEACERNKDVILPMLQRYLESHRCILEVGSGSGQHALYFSQAMSSLKWLPSDLSFNLPALQENLQNSPCENILPPLALDVSVQPWQIPHQPDAIFTANTLHIMDENSVQAFFEGAGELLTCGGKVCVYGPFRYNGEYTSASNANFDLWLKDRDPRSGIRDFETVDGWARNNGMQLHQDHAMPANNQFVIWEKS